MVQRATCTNDQNASPNGAQITDGKGRTSAILQTESAGQLICHAADDPTPSNPRFSLFRWFKRTGNRDSTIDKRRKTNGRSRNSDGGGECSVFSSAESVDTFYSTTTVRSFDYHTGTLGRNEGVVSLDILRQASDVGPFAAGASKVALGNKENDVADVACTLPTNTRNRNLTARYSLQPTATFNSCGNLPDKRLSGSLRRLDERGKNSCNGTGRRKVHVKGKRRAPNPPCITVKSGEVDARDTARNSNRRKRRAPKPPEKGIEEHSLVEGCMTKPTDGGMDVELPKEKEDEQTISNDTLVLQRGVLLSKKEIKQSPKVTRNGNSISSDTNTIQDNPNQIPTIGTLSTAMPRPWYKRSVFEHSRDSGLSRRGDVLRGPSTSTVEVKEECAGPSSSNSPPADASLSRLSFFHRSGQSEDRKKETKRKSGLSILMNISELDKEAAAIVQEEQARARASMLLKSSRFVDAYEKRSDANEEIVQDIVTSNMENSSPRRGTRALISKFNAISNITKVTVNTNFFAKNNKEQQNSRFDRDIVRSTRVDPGNEYKEQERFSVQESSQRVNVERDISKYFPPQQKTSRVKSEVVDADTKLPGSRSTSSKEQSGQLAAETSSRISFLQSQLAANRMKDSTTPTRDFTPVAVEEKIRSNQVVSSGTQEGTRLNNDGMRKYLLSRVSTTAQKTENVTNVSQVTKGIERKYSDEGPKDFSNLLEEIDKHLLRREFKFKDRGTPPPNIACNQKDKVFVEEPGTSSKVTKVLDILVEREKDNKAKAVAQPEKSIPAATTSHLTDVNSKLTSSKPRSPLLKTTDDPVTIDLKEMLKEMKHSLPKRPKSKNVSSQDVNIVKNLNTKKETPPSSPRKTTYFVSAVTKVENIALQNDYEMEKQKVSSSVQTSGNIRRLNQSSVSSEGPFPSGWKQENVLYRTSGKSLAGGALVKNTFQLIRPRDFAEIEAIKTTKTPYKENTYANVIEQSLYANAHVPPLPPPPLSPRQRPPPVQSKTAGKKGNTGKVADTPRISEGKVNVNDDSAGDSDEDDNQVQKDMNTLAINRLLRRLEAAIASGHHQQAAGLAKELARLKIHCSVIRQRSAARLKDQLIKVNMYIEDKLAHQGPIPLQLPTRMTVAELKAKIFTDFEIPCNVQRWIIGKNLADHDNVTLHELHAIDGSPIFLYLVAPETKTEKVVQVENVIKKEEEIKAVQGKTVEEAAKTIEQIPEVMEEPEEKEEEISAELKQERYEALISLENCDVIPNSEPIECPICFVTYGPREGVILRDCLHMFCRACLSNTIKYCEDAEVKCPYRDLEYTCESTLQEREIKALVEAEIYQQHLAKSIAQAETSAGNNAFHCKTPDCPGWCIYDDDVNNFLCPVCGANNCLTCQVIHAGKNCKQYQLELRFAKDTDQESRRTAAMLEDMVDRGEALACPTCAVVLMKKWGCDWLRCSMCKTEICWVTRGPRWGPGGKGDTSGGCRCGENGVKCHPRCNYCH